MRADRALLASASLLIVAVAAGAARAAFSSTAGASAAVSTATVGAPSSLTAACTPATNTVTLTWTATTTPSATGYAILGSAVAGGPYEPVGTTTGRLTTTYVDTIAVLQTQYYIVEATRNDWTSAGSNQTGVHSVALGICVPA